MHFSFSALRKLLEIKYKVILTHPNQLLFSRARLASSCLVTKSGLFRSRASKIVFATTLKSVPSVIGLGMLRTGDWLTANAIRKAYIVKVFIVRGWF